MHSVLSFINQNKSNGTKLDPCGTSELHQTTFRKKGAVVLWKFVCIYYGFVINNKNVAYKIPFYKVRKVPRYSSI